jgi:drug/metabolite transporter (DMT)-like permease
MAYVLADASEGARQMTDTVLGILIMLASTSMTNIGTVIQKKAVDRLPPFEGRSVLENVANVLKTPLWLIGWAMGVVALVSNMVALGMADISVIQPLIGFGLAVLAIFSYYYLGERLTPMTLAGVGAVIAGVVLIGVTASEGRGFTDTQELLASYTHRTSVISLGVFLLMIFGLWALAKRVGKMAGVLYAVVAAACSVFGLTFSKGLFGIPHLIGWGAALALWPTWLLLVIMLPFSTLAMFLQQMSFQKGRAVVVAPVFAATSVVLPLAMGALVFDEAVAWLTIVAVLFIVVGVVLLGMKPEQDEP